MANKQVASVTINTGNKGSSENGVVKLLKSLLSETKGLKDIFSKATKLSSSGLSGGGSSSLLSKLLTTGGGAVALGLASLTIGGDTPQTASGTGLGFQEALIDGEKKILAVNEQTGKVQDVLTLQEATDKGILDEKGRVKDQWKTQSKIIQESIDSLGTYHGSLLISNQQLMDISSEERKQLEFQKQITAALEKKARELGTTGRVVDTPSGKQSTYNNYLQAADAITGQSQAPARTDYAPFKDVETKASYYDDRNNWDSSVNKKISPFFDINGRYRIG